MYNHINVKNNEAAPLLADNIYEIIQKVCRRSIPPKVLRVLLLLPVIYLVYFPSQNAEKLDSEIVYDRDFDYDYFGFKVCVGGLETEIANLKTSLHYWQLISCQLRRPEA